MHMKSKPIPYSEQKHCTCNFHECNEEANPLESASKRAPFDVSDPFCSNSLAELGISNIDYSNLYYFTVTACSDIISQLLTLLPFPYEVSNIK